jgi:hypothetical protein
VNKPKNKTILLETYADNKQTNIREGGLEAIGACCKGDATPYQQRLAIETIAYDLCNLFKTSFNAENPRFTDFNEGKKHIGIIKGV